MVNLHPVTAAPRVPSRCPYHSGISCINTCPARSREVLSPVEFTCFTRERVVTQPEGRAPVQYLQGRHEKARSRAAEA
jgi:hypothetical protein